MKEKKAEKKQKEREERENKKSTGKSLKWKQDMRKAPLELLCAGSV